MATKGSSPNMTEGGFISWLHWRCPRPTAQAQFGSSLSAYSVSLASPLGIDYRRTKVCWSNANSIQLA